MVLSNIDVVKSIYSSNQVQIKGSNQSKILPLLTTLVVCFVVCLSGQYLPDCADLCWYFGSSFQFRGECNMQTSQPSSLQIHE